MDKTFGEKVQGVKYFDRTGAYLVVIEDNKTAVVKTHRGYFLLGGGIEKDENHIECIKRECLEEAGYEIRVENYIGSAEMYSNHERIGYFHPIQYYYRGHLEKHVTEQIEEDHKLKWISIDEAEKKMYVPGQLWAIKKCLEKSE
ncbi:MAG: NUDIX domain-containing protein [Eubacterium sp.]